MMMIAWIVASLFVIGYGKDVTFNYESCSSVGSNVTVTAAYTGNGTVTAVQWYFSGAGSNLAVTAATCIVFGPVPAGYPDSSRMSYECPATHSLSSNTFKLTLTGLKDDELKYSWGATFTVSGLPNPDVVDSPVLKCNRVETALKSWQTALGVGALPLLFAVGIFTGVILSTVANKWWNKLFDGKNRILLVILSILVVGLGFWTVHRFLKRKAITENDHQLTEKGTPSATNGK